MRREWGLLLCCVWLWCGFVSVAVGAGIPLKATTAASAGANGVAELGPGWISLDLERLPPGTYRVQAIVKPRHAVIALAWIAVVDPEGEPTFESGRSLNVRGSAHQAAVLKTRSQISLPPNLSAEEIESIVITDLAGCRWLVGHVHKPVG